MAQTFQNFSRDSIDDLKVVGYQPLDCSGNAIGSPLTVLPTVVLNKTQANICNTSDIYTPIVNAVNALAASNTVENTAITTALNNILTQVTAVNANTDTIEASLTTLIADQLAGNVTLTEIKTAITNLLPELQAINANTDTVEALIASTNTKIDALIAEQDKEFISTAPTKFHIGTINYYSREIVIYDSETATQVSKITEYSTDGIVFTTTAPIGTPLIGWYVTPITVVNYDKNETQIAQNNTIALTANTYHSVSIVVLSGSATIEVNGVSFIAPAGYSNSWEADTLLTNQITVTSVSASDLVIIDTIK